MAEILIVYATREGQTHRVSEYLAREIRRLGHSVEVADAAHPPERDSLRFFDAAILAASVHVQRHEKEMIAFVKKNRRQLERMPTAFLSVSLSEAGAENEARTEKERDQSSDDAFHMIDAFYDETGWQADLAKPVAGALLYRKYGLLTRFVMKHIAKRSGGATDTSRDHEYTNWADLDRFAAEFVAHIPAPIESVHGAAR